jgi:hypothetical protein
MVSTFQLTRTVKLCLTHQETAESTEEMKSQIPRCLSLLSLLPFTGDLFRLAFF